VPELERRLKEQIEGMIDLKDLVPSLTVDSWIDPPQISLGLVSELSRLEPFGEGNKSPIFAMKDVQLDQAKRVGKEGKHLKAWFIKDGARMEAIGFGMGSRAGALNYCDKYDLAFKLESNEYNGFESVQLSLVDIREGI